MSQVQVVSQSDFQQQVLKGELPVFVDFYADWCGPCKMIAPVLDELSEEYAGKMAFKKLNIDENSDLAAEYGVLSIPNMIVFKNGKQVDQVIGAVSRDRLKATIEKHTA